MNLYFPAPTSSQNSSDQSGNWRLQSGRAITLSPAAGGQLSVASGQLWATLGSSGRWRQAATLERCATYKDYFLSAGDALTVPPGASLVVESFNRTQSVPVAFAWSLTPQLATRSKRAGVVQAAAELGQALAQVARALGRLAGAVLIGAKPDQRLETCL